LPLALKFPLGFPLGLDLPFRFRGALVSPNLTAIFLATVNGQHMKSFDVGRVMLKRFGHLNGQFTSRRERQDLNVFVLHIDTEQ